MGARILHSLLKREWLNRFKIFDYKHAYRLVFEYIETFYNTVRIHSHCGYLSPDEYEKQYRNKLLELEQKTLPAKYAGKMEKVILNLYFFLT